jgi:hypothetical protein
MFLPDMVKRPPIAQFQPYMRHICKSRGQLPGINRKKLPIISAANKGIKRRRKGEDKH